MANGHPFPDGNDISRNVYVVSEAISALHSGSSYLWPSLISHLLVLAGWLAGEGASVCGGIAVGRRSGSSGGQAKTSVGLRSK